MRSHARRALWFTLILAALIGMSIQDRAPAAALESVSEPHDFVQRNLSCNHCHAVVGVKSRGLMRKPVNQICSECHRMSGALHPVDIDPAITIPADLPLDANGLLTCATCHNIHRSRLDPVSGRKTMYLRRDGPTRALCEACHREGILPEYGVGTGGK